MLNNRKARVTTLAATGAATIAAVTVGGAAPANADTGVWDRVAQCESGGNWSINTGNGYYGGLQFTPSTWRAFGGSGMPNQASKAEQIRVAQRTLAAQGPGAWPVCSKRAGLTASNGGSSSSSSVDTQEQERETEAPQRRSETRERNNDRPERTETRERSSRSSERAEVKQDAPAKKSTHKSSKSEKKSFSKSEKKSTKHTHKKSVPSVKASNETITVKAGDTLGKLAEKHGIDSWRTLWAANSKTVSNPNLIFVGQVLNLPA